uniref:Peptidase S1 domain-containing protein n=1 Tax=Zonotrichia albicollis TaxID=44394 RepID=A0A8D2MC04_ZONAL
MEPFAESPINHRRIIGGRKVKAHSRPYMAYLEIQGDPKNYSCGGFLIRPDAVLSAAHCGDSGGPLVCKKKAHGIVSHVCPCNIFPEVFTRISHFEPWIREQLTRFVFQDNSLLSVV